MREPTAALTLSAARLATVAGVLALALPRVVAVTGTGLVTSFDQNLENPAVNTILLLKQGVNVYAEGTFAAPPFNLLMYTPAYHYLVAALPSPPGISPFTLPRLVSAGAMFVAAGALLLIPATRAGRLLAVAAAMFFLAIPGVTRHIAYARQDPMALALSLGALLVLSRRTSRGAIVASAGLAALAILTKQSYVSAAVAGAIYLWHLRWTKGLTFIVTVGLIGSAAAVVAHLAWGPGFWWSVLVVPTQSYDWRQYGTFATEMAQQWTYAAVIVFGIGIWVRALIRPASSPRAPITPLAVYVPVAFIVLALTLGKRGADLNYFFEPTLVLLAYLVERADRPLESPRARMGLALVLLAFLALVAIDYIRIPADRYTYITPAKLGLTDRVIRQVRMEIGTLDGPTQRILFPPYFAANYTYLLDRPLYLSDPYLYTLLWAEGKLPIDSFIESIANGYFDVVVLPWDEDPQRPKYGWQAGADRFYEAVRREYRLGLTGVYQYHVRRQSSRRAPSAPSAGR